MNLKKPPLEEGIYFKLSNDDYHNDLALSHSGMTKLLISWPDYWMTSGHNPNRGDFVATDAMKFGERSGMLLLEREKFHEKYNTYHRHKGAGKGIYLSSVEYNKIKESVDAIRKNKMGNDYFSNGYPEVSIFWRDVETGIMLRARIDYLRTFGAIDFKRIKGVNPWEIGQAVRNQGLDIQNAHFIDGIRNARAMLCRPNPPIFGGEHVDKAWLKAFIEDEDLLFRFVFQRSTAPYIWKIRELDNDVLMTGIDDTRRAIMIYQENVRKYGLGEPQLGDETVGEISQYHVPRRNYE